MTDGCRGCVCLQSSVEKYERLADDESRSWVALDDASGTRLHFMLDFRLGGHLSSIIWGSGSQFFMNVEPIDYLVYIWLLNDSI